MILLRWSGRKSLGSMALYCLLADHDYDTEIAPKLQKNENAFVFKYFADTSKYGPALNAFSGYTQHGGIELAIAMNVAAEMMIGWQYKEEIRIWFCIYKELKDARRDIAIFPKVL